WNTSDDATAALMERFYAELKDKAPAQALRAAQVEMLRKPGAKASEWAGFMAYTQGG
ncbi:MAG: CHAT domain-containing protein, partial [Gemmataceae bacterium]|nr:CHAT domain-containing protein [Gemmataceae bacterium]